LIKQEIKFFILIGLLTVVVDFLTYSLLLFFFEEFVDLSKGIGFICGTIFSYFSNKSLTFSHVKYRSGSFNRHIFLYIFSMTLNILTNRFVIDFLSEFEYKLIIAFLIATSISTILNFIGLKFFVFREST